MSAIVPAIQFEFEIARSLVIDCHTEVDLAIRTRLKRLGIEPKSLLAHNVTALGNAKACPRYSKRTKAQVDAAIARFKDANDLRCDIVHGLMTHLTVWNVRHACFINVGKVTEAASQATIMSKPQLDALADQFREIAKAILCDAEAATKITPSSPPPPLPGAAGDP